MTQSELSDYQSTDYKDEETLRRLYWDEGMTQSEIGEIFGVSHGAIKHFMNKYGIETRDSSEYHKKPRATYYMHSDGYMSWKNGGEEVLVHRLIAVAEYGFGSVCDMSVHHGTNIPWDNRPENLELMSHDEHQSHHSTGEDNQNSKLTVDDVKEIKELLKNTDLTHKEIADRFGVTDANITHINCDRAWSHVKSA